MGLRVFYRTRLRLRLRNGRDTEAEIPYFRMGGAVFTAAGRFSVKSLKNPIRSFPCPPVFSAILESGFFP